MKSTTLIHRASLALLAALALPFAGCIADAPDPGEEGVTEAADALVLGGYQVVSAETTVSTSPVKQLSVACPAGKLAMSAGWSVLDTTSAILNGLGTYSAPSFDGSSWLTNAKSLAGATPWKLKVSVICATAAALPGYEVRQVETASSTSTVKQVNVACSAGKSAVGGGFAVLDDTSAILDGEALYFQPGFDGTSWLMNAQNNSSFSPSWKLRGHAICASTASLAGYTVTTQSTALNTTALKQLNIGCPSGKHATGAGWGALDSTNAILNGSGRFFQQTFGGTRWLTNAVNLSGFSPSWKLQVSVLCVN